MNRPLTKVLSAVAAAAVAVATLAAAAPAGAAGSSCSTRWGSLPESAAGRVGATVVNVRAGRHQCFDRLVVDLRGPVAGYEVAYVASVVQDGSGDAVALRGGASIEIRVHAPAHDDDGNATYSPARRAEAVRVIGFATFRQVSFAGSFEGDTTIGLGVRARLPFRAFVLDGPGAGSRLVIDVAHRW